MFCTKCGMENRDDALYCKRCGAKLVMRGNGKKPAKRGILAIIVLFFLLICIAAAILIASQKKREKDYNDKVTQADHYLETLDYERAEAEYLAAINVDPKQAEPYLKLSQIYEDQGETVKARKILEQGLKETGDREIEHVYSYYDFLENDLNNELGKSTPGTYELSYGLINEYYARPIPADGVAGLVNYRMMDFDHDGEEEILALVIRKEYDEITSLGMDHGNVLCLQMYEKKENDFILQDEYRADGMLLGIADYESDGVFIKPYEDELYICGGLFSTTYLLADGSQFVSFALTYNGNSFELYTGQEELAVGSDFGGDDNIKTAEEMAEKLRAIDLPEAADYIETTYMTCMSYEDEAIDILFRVEGDNVGGSSYSFQESGNVDDLGKVVLKYWINDIQSDDKSEEAESEEPDNGGGVAQEDIDRLRSELDEIDISSESAFDNAISTTEMVGAFSDARVQWESKMQEIYTLLLQNSSVQEQEKLNQEQNAWLEERDNNAEAAAAEYEGGSLGRVEAASSRCQATKERCYELLDRLENR